MRIVNWSQTESCCPYRFLTPQGLDQLRAAVAENSKVRCVGSGLSPNGVGFSNGVLISLECMPPVFELDEAAGVVRVSAQTKVHELCAQLAERNFALPTLGSIVEQTVGGVVSTATHGSSFKVGSFSSLVRVLEMILPDGDILRVDHDHPHFPAFCCSLGCLGVLTHVTLEVVPLYAVRVRESTHPYEKITDLMERAREFDFYKLLYLPHTDQLREWTGSKTSSSGMLGGNPPKVSPVYSLVYEGFLAGTLFSPRLNRMGEKAHQKLRQAFDKIAEKPSFQPYVEALTVDCLYSQHVTEFGFDLLEARAFIDALRSLLKRANYLVHAPVEIRFGPAEQSWLSPAYQRKTCWIGLVRYRPFGFEPPDDGLFTQVRNLAQRHGGREHLAKIPREYKVDVELNPMVGEFGKLRQEYDPSNKLLGSCLREILS